jgi:hypothetical protein
MRFATQEATVLPHTHDLHRIALWVETELSKLNTDLLHLNVLQFPTQLTALFEVEAK